MILFNLAWDLNQFFCFWSMNHVFKWRESRERGKENCIDSTYGLVVDDREIDFTNRNEVCFHFDLFSLSHSSSFVYHSHFLRTTIRRTRRLVYSPSMHKTMIKQMHLINTMNQSKDVPHSFARGFDDFDVTWPPSTNITSINDDK